MRFFTSNSKALNRVGAGKFYTKSGLPIFAWLLFLLVGCSDDRQKPMPLGPIFNSVPSEHSGLSFSNNIIETADFNYFVYDCAYQGAGVAVGDINNDGLDDIYFAGNQEANKLYLNKGNLQFEDITVAAGVQVTDGWSTGVVFVDINADGYEDLFVSRFLWTHDNDIVKNLVFINNGDLTFTEKSKELGLDQAGFTVQHSFLDYDKDGDLDIYVLNQPPCEQELKRDLIGTVNLNFTDRLFRNDGGTFQEVTGKAGITNYAYGLSASIFDFDSDGWPDIYVANDYEEPDILYHNNQDGTFTNVINKSVGHTSNFSMGSDAADFNNDGQLDVVVVDMVARDNKRLKTNMSGMNPSRFSLLVDTLGFKAQFMFNTLQLNNGNSTFSEVAQLAGIDRTDWSWTPLFADFDLDGLKDLFITNGLKRDVRNNDFNKKGKKMSEEHGSLTRDKSQSSSSHFLKLLSLAPTTKLHDYLFINNGNLTFNEVSEEMGVDVKTWAQGAAYSDLDNDGDLDLILNAMDNPAILYENLSADQKRGNFLAVYLTGPKLNPHATGTRVTLKSGDGEQMIEQTISRGYMSASTKSIHFGLTGSGSDLELIVEWPDNTRSIIKNPKLNSKVKIDYRSAARIPFAKTDNSINKLFEPDKAAEVGLAFVHSENMYNDYEKEILLPHKMSVIGPKTAVADVNNDGLDDIYICGAKGQKGQLYLQKNDGQFETITVSDSEKSNRSDETGAVFFDADNDSDLDLFIVHGGNELEDGSVGYQDKLYLNEGNSTFSLAKGSIPEYHTSSSCVLPFDFDSDGDLDLFVGGRQVPGKWPLTPPSVILQNQDGVFTDVSTQAGANIQFTGMVTDAKWGDIDGNGKNELVVVGEWMPISVFEFNGNAFVQNAISDQFENLTGWWNTIEINDVDDDGDLDLLLGNLGLNIKYKASREKPFEVFYGDFDSTGTGDIYLGYYEGENLFPVRGRECSSQQMPVIKERFPTYEEFGSATVTDVLGDALQNAVHKKATTFASCIAWNNNGSFEVISLPNEAQISNTSGIEIVDLNKDGKKDLIIAGNYFEREVETVRSDAGAGLVLLGGSDRSFIPLFPRQSGLYANGDVRDISLVELTNKELGLLVANNNSRLQLFKLNVNSTQP